MKIMDSILVDSQKEANSFYGVAKTHGIGVTTRAREHGRYRIWKLTDSDPIKVEKQKAKAREQNRKYLVKKLEPQGALRLLVVFDGNFFSDVVS